jgi:hypothetical protein
VPATEAQGRVHTSTASVVVLPEADDVEVQIDERDLEINIAASGTRKDDLLIHNKDELVRVWALRKFLAERSQQDAIDFLKSKLKNYKTNVEFLLSLAIALEGLERTWAIAADTDGIDGSEDNAGAICDPGSLTRMRAAGADPAARLAANDSWGAFAAAGGLVVTGPTLTNVNDFRAILILP